MQVVLQRQAVEVEVLTVSMELAPSDEKAQHTLSEGPVLGGCMYALQKRWVVSLPDKSVKRAYCVEEIVDVPDAPRVTARCTLPHPL